MTASEPTEVLRIDTEALVGVLESEPLAGGHVMDRFVAMIQREFTVPAVLAQVRRLAGPLTEEMSRLGLTMYRLSLWLKSPRPYLMLVGFALFLGFWYLAVEVWKLPRFREMPGVTSVVKEWLRQPDLRLSVYTEEYYQHILVSIWRVTKAFFLATVLGVSFGLLLGWSRKFKEYVFPVFEMLRPIPILAWVPLAIVMFIATESAVVYLAFLARSSPPRSTPCSASESIDESYIRAANCLARAAGRCSATSSSRVAALHLHRPADLDRRVVVLAGRRRDGVRPVRPGLRDQHLLRDGALPDHRHRHGHAGHRRLPRRALVRIAGDYLMEWRVRELALQER